MQQIVRKTVKVKATKNSQSGQDQQSDQSNAQSNSSSDQSQATNNQDSEQANSNSGQQSHVVNGQNLYRIAIQYYGSGSQRNVEKNQTSQ
ncbi:hypothetical protein ABLV89_02185 [Staphylococcus equorum]